jgi:hypothetical protein
MPDADWRQLARRIACAHATTAHAACAYAASAHAGRRAHASSGHAEPSINDNAGGPSAPILARSRAAKHSEIWKEPFHSG